MDWIRRTLLLISLSSGIHTLTPQSYLSQKEVDNLMKNVFEPVFSLDLNQVTRQSLHYAVAGSKLLGRKVPEAKICNVLASKLSGVKEISHLYDVAVPISILGCTLGEDKLNEAKKVIKGADLNSPAGLFYAFFISQKLSIPFSLDTAVIEKSLSAGIKVDDSLLNLGYAFHLAGEEGAISKSSLSSYFSRIEDALAQADEVDGKFLQFEGGLSITNFILSGLLKLTERAKKPFPMTDAQLVKFVNYFMNRKSVQSIKGAFNLLEGINNLSKSQLVEPVAVTLASPGVISDASPKIRVRVSDLFGNPLSGKFDVTIESASPKIGKTPVILKGTKMAPVAGEASLFEVDMKSLKPARGFYTLAINVNGGSSSKKYVGLQGVSFDIKVSSAISIENAFYTVGDADQSTPSPKSPIKLPDKFSLLKLDSRQKFSFKFSLKDKDSSGSFKAHQVFVRLFNKNSEIIYVSERESEQSSAYKFEFNVASKVADFNGKSGKYSIELIVGDVLISNPITWTIGDVDISFSTSAESETQSTESGMLPEIKHLFKEPEKRPPSYVSNAFMFLCLAPIFIMFISWAKIGVNVSGFPFSLSSIGFHLGLGSIFVLYFYFWLKLNMFTTVKYLIVLGLFTFVTGNSMLAQIAKRKKA
ncbi:dolichyl-diphosphooligosaccharide--protein glycosyltransferase subunit 2 [Lepeophtheirus salmonis]|uniref:dolichyl-diphosphooligosaccharide--protein glycosyltransferase subunit 2 n=1 Tax=Lepeophtheirus salmonis TaxID=72036 RepID=UPI001AE3FCFD|nr:dolichyl-diphosphooligosaccharide--protein glycosyltransferase subunit 2-like [Lepeophtheirus salmonis]XP_040576043.1 dolichyl-diphosphooligosaccharide--protein glycosyltransferase subunit 2-like [Lepeophtheirus salmonis]